MPLRRIELFGVPVDCTDWPRTLDTIERELLGTPGTKTILAVNPEKVMRARRDPALLLCLRNAAVLIPDGIGVVLAARLLGLGKMQRVPGAELMPRLCDLAVRRGLSVYLLGASPEVNDALATTLPRLHPGIRVAGHHHGYIEPEAMPDVIARINDSGAEILFVALGSPKQELWMTQHASALRVRICQGVGGTFDVLTGNVRRAPRAFIALNLEWLYRLLAQPQRLIRQKALPQFAWLLCRALITSDRTSTPPLHR